MILRDPLREVVCKTGVPYGYTLTVWASGALCIGRFGLPSAGEVFLFVAGGTLGYVGLALLVGGTGVVRAARPPAALWENVSAVPAVGVTYALDRVVGSVGLNFFLSPLAATLTYLLALAVLVAWVMSRERGVDGSGSLIEGGGRR